MDALAEEAERVDALAEAERVDALAAGGELSVKSKPRPYKVIEGCTESLYAFN